MAPHHLALALAIAAELVGTSLLKASDGFSRPWVTLGTLAAYLLSFWCLSLALRAIPMGIAYAIWSGVGIVLITLVGWLVFGQRIDGAGLAGMGLIVAGVLVIHLGSASG